MQKAKRGKRSQLGAVAYCYYMERDIENQGHEPAAPLHGPAKRHKPV